MGFFSVVFVAAILAGSGCHVLKKDQAVEFDAVRSLAAQLKADNVKTLGTITTMQEGVEQKDTIIKRLQEEVTATHEKTPSSKKSYQISKKLSKNHQMIMLHDQRPLLIYKQNWTLRKLKQLQN